MQTPPPIIPSNAPHVAGSPWLLEDDADEPPQPEPQEVPDAVA